jgi:hypothetical protein
VNFLRNIAGFLGWLAGALAGVGAVLYALGYLIFSAHLKFLGIYGMLDENSAYFVREGGIFVADVVMDIAQVLLPLSSIIGVFALLAAGLRFWLAPRLRKWFPALYEREGRWWGAFLRWPKWRELFYVVLFLLFLEHSGWYLNQFNRPLLISSALYGACCASNSAKADDKEMVELREFLLGGNEEQRDTYFLNLLWGEALSGLLLFSAWRVTAGWKSRRLLLSWFVLGFLIYSVLLPMDYGVLINSTQYPVITLNPKDDAALTKDFGKLFLISRTAEDFIVWDARTKEIVWVPKSELKRAQVAGVEDLFGH